jgi:HpcH/HpaI aldolase/citrate lyase family
MRRSRQVDDHRWAVRLDQGARLAGSTQVAVRSAGGAQVHTALPEEPDEALPDQATGAGDEHWSREIGVEIARIHTLRDYPRVSSFDLFLFARDPELLREASAAGIAGIVVDWERRGKRERQAGADTEIRADTPADLALVRRMTGARVLCRVDGPGEGCAEEIEQAIELGADEVLLPMVRTRDEVERALEQVDGRCGLGILVETEDAVRASESLSSLPLSRVYVGLNDLMIDRGASSLFEPLVDGTVEGIRGHFEMPFGVAGLTLPDLGFPVPCRLLIAEMTRLGCDFSFLRRSFLRDVERGSIAAAVDDIGKAIDGARRRKPKTIEDDRGELASAVGRGLVV